MPALKNTKNALALIFAVVAGTACASSGEPRVETLSEGRTAASCDSPRWVMDAERCMVDSYRLNEIYLDRALQLIDGSMPTECNDMLNSGQTALAVIGTTTPKSKDVTPEIIYYMGQHFGKVSECFRRVSYELGSDSETGKTYLGLSNRANGLAGRYDGQLRRMTR